jgi:FkbM family methyltransferase
MSMMKQIAKRLLCGVTAHMWARDALRSIAQTGLLPRRVWDRVPVKGQFRVDLPGGNGFVCNAVDGDGVISRRLFWRGWLAYEPETIQVFYKLAQHSNVVLDIGANTGFFTLLACAANSASTIVTFEPVPYIYARLVDHIRMNAWEDRCQARCEAVSNIQGSAKFHVPFCTGIPVASSLNTQGYNGYAGYLIDVPVTTIDEVCAGERVDLIKIDVENYEDKVLEGMQRVLAASMPTIVLECYPEGPFRSVEAMLAPFGYRFFHLRQGGPVPLERIIPDVRRHDKNFLCTVRHADILMA